MAPDFAAACDSRAGACHVNIGSSRMPATDCRDTGWRQKRASSRRLSFLRAGAAKAAGMRIKTGAKRGPPARGPCPASSHTGIGSMTEARMVVSFAMPSAGGCWLAWACISYFAVLSVPRVFSRCVLTSPVMLVLNPQ